jgi:hypothetical protein
VLATLSKPRFAGCKEPPLGLFHRFRPSLVNAFDDKILRLLVGLSTSTVVVNLTGAAGMWSDFNAANRSAMLKSEVISWPVTLGIMLLAWGVAPNQAPHPSHDTQPIRTAFKPSA